MEFRRGFWVADRIPRTVAIAAIALLALTLTAGVADARTFKGKTSDGKQAKLVTDSNGRVKSATFEYRAKCSGGGKFTAPMGVRRPLDFSSQKRFFDADRVKDKQNGLKFRYRQRVEGERKTENLWKGTFEVRIRVFDGSEPLGTCKARKTNWYVQSKG
jgi:hypothetical protein